LYVCLLSKVGSWLDFRKGLGKNIISIGWKNKGYPFDSSRIGINYGLHFTGGEPFLNFELLLKAVKIADELKIPSTFVETNCFWCVNDEMTRERISRLRDEGLKGILVSVNPFILKQVPFERTERAYRISREIFGENVIVYQGFFYEDFKRLGVRGTMPFKEYLQKSPYSLSYVELLPMGRRFIG